MAALSTYQEWQSIREAIQTLTATGQSVVSISIDGMSTSYNASQMPQLQARESELLRRLSIRNVRKRTVSEYC